MGGVVDLVEAIYDFEADSESAWLQRLVATAGPLDAGMGVVAYTYDAGDVTKFALGTVAIGGSSSFDHSAVGPLLSNLDPGYVAATWRSLLCATASQTPGISALPQWAAFQSFGLGDIMAINGLNPNGAGLWLGAFLPRAKTLTRRETLLYQRIATHLAAGFRLRARLGTSKKRRPLADCAEAVVTPSGKIDHATGDATEAGARTALRDAVRTIEHARGRQRRSAPERSVEDWQALVQATWSLVDDFQSDGKRYVVACRNEAESGGLDSLSSRERQVAVLASLGRSSKVIAYELGLAGPTVRVLLSRAARKLGARTRGELIAAVVASSHR